MTDNPLKRPGTYVDTSPERLLYEERHSATSRPLFAVLWLGLGVALVGAVLAAVGTDSSAFSVVAVMGAIVAAFAAVFLVALRPIGIRITTRRVTIGAVSHGGGPDAAVRTRRDGTVPPRRWVFSCDWEGIHSIVLASGRGGIRRVSSEARGGFDRPGTGVVGTLWPTPLGMLDAPGTRTLLVIRVDPSRATYPRPRPRKRGPWFESPVLGVPTRHPEKLHQALASFPAAARVTDEITESAERRSY